MGKFGDGLIALAIGTLLLLMGYRLIGKKPGESVTYDERMDRYKWLFRIGGLIVILGGLAKIFVPD